MNYLKLWNQAKNSLIFNESLNLMKQIEQNNCVSFVRVKIMPWDEMVNKYEVESNGSIYVVPDNIHFTSDMKKFCGEEFEIAITSNLGKMLFWLIDNQDTQWIITKHMVNFIEHKNFEINKNWPLIEIYCSDIIKKMWTNLYKKCNKSEQKILYKIVETVNE